jgi:hypothetical protein
MLAHPAGNVRVAFAKYAREHMTPRALARILRRLAKDPDMDVRRNVGYILQRAKLQEVALPAKKDGDWNPSGWALTEKQSKITRHKTGKRVLERTGVPPIADLAGLRTLLNIKSPKQLGFFLLASDFKNGPYTTHTVPKRSGGERLICAPKKQLKWVQKQILKHILSKVPPHPAAHGFVNGRSTVSNATPHVGAELVVKFDLKDFFPTVHYFRVMGLFASLGYPLGNCMFGTADESNQIAPVLLHAEPEDVGQRHAAAGRADLAGGVEPRLPAARRAARRAGGGEQWRLHPLRRRPHVLVQVGRGAEPRPVPLVGRSGVPAGGVHGQPGEVPRHPRLAAAGGDRNRRQRGGARAEGAAPRAARNRP